MVELAAYTSCRPIYLQLGGYPHSPSGVGDWQHWRLRRWPHMVPGRPPGAIWPGCGM